MFSLPPNFSIHMFKIKTYNKCFSPVCNEKPSRLKWATCVTESLFFLLLKEKIVTGENSIQLVPLHTCSGTRQTLTEMLVLSRKTSSMSNGFGGFVFLQILCILAAHCFIVFPVTRDVPVRLTQLNQSLVRRYMLMFETLKALVLSLSCRSVQWPRQLL